MKKNMIILAASLLSTQAFAVQEIPDTNINDFAIASTENNETVIRYNPEYCETLNNQICDFFIAHEYGHIALDHPLGGEYTIEEEYAADCWVTQNAQKDLSKTAYAYFTNEGDMSSWNHDSGMQRAKNITECPKEETSPAKKQLSKDNSSNQKQTRSRYNHYRADAVFSNIERQYSHFFPQSSFASKYGSESIIAGYLDYTKRYRNGSALSEYRGLLMYKIPSLGIGWTVWGSLVNWRL